MADYFALLNEPRRPWLDAELLKAKFLSLSAEVHPDRVHNAKDAEKRATSGRFAELNVAFKCLSDPKERLQHLLALECGGKLANIQSAPAVAMELFVMVAEILRGADALLKEKSAATSPLLKVQVMEKALDFTDRIHALQQRLAAARDALEGELQPLNATWDKAPPLNSPGRADALPLARVEEIYRALSFLSRWSAQLQERAVELTM